MAKPVANVPVSPFSPPSRFGRKNPPTPPAAPTMPVMTPISWPKRCGTSWNTEPLPIPSRPMPRNSSTSATPTGGSRAMPSIVAATPAYSTTSMRMPPKRSAR
jgi:hypothetical protein